MKSKSYHTNDIFDARPGILDILKCEADWSYVRNNIVQLTIVQLTAHYIGRYFLQLTFGRIYWRQLTWGICKYLLTGRSYCNDPV